MEALCAHTWPGNVRELANAIERASVLCQGNQIQASDLPLRMNEVPEIPKQSSLDDVERSYIERVLGEQNWNITRSASVLGIDRVTLYNKIKKYGLQKP